MSTRFYRFLTALFFILATAAFLVELSGNKTRVGFEHVDKIVHFGIFFVLAMLCYKAFNLSFFKALIYLSFYAIATELAQHYYTSRTGDFFDFLADMFGVICFYLLLTCFPRFWENKTC